MKLKKYNRTARFPIPQNKAEERQVLHLGVAFDLNYLSPFTVLLTSVLQNNAKSEINIHAIVSGLNQTIKGQLKKYINRHGGDIFFYEVQDERIARFSIPQNQQWSDSVYHRLFLPGMLPPDVERLLYLDTDTVVVADLAELYNSDLCGFVAGAVPELSATISREDIGITEPGVYFNSGVMLIDVKSWLTQQISERAIDLLLNYPGKLQWADQDALNLTLNGKYLKLAGKYNAIHSDVPPNRTRAGYEKFVRDQVVIHYTLKNNKPWIKTCSSKLRFVYMSYLFQSPCWKEGFFINMKYDLVMLHRRLKKATRRLQTMPDLNHKHSMETMPTSGNHLLPLYLQTSTYKKLTNDNRR
jgi:lipopolysaccharide biosynthesis glycosyltransferase